MVTQLSPRQAHELLESRETSLLIDVRSSMEYLFVGHPVNAHHIAWIDDPDWEINPDFSAEVKSLINTRKLGVDEFDVHIVLICRSGKRSLEAGNLLANNGFRQVYNINEGFEGELDGNHHRSTVGGWRFWGLPWVQC